jgi:hypothetical protein
MVRDIKMDLKKVVFNNVEWIDWLGLGSLSGSLPDSVKQGNENVIPWITLNFLTR